MPVRQSNELSADRLRSLPEWQLLMEHARSLEKAYITSLIGEHGNVNVANLMRGRIEMLQALQKWPDDLEALYTKYARSILSDAS